MGWQIKNSQATIDHGVVKNLGDEFSESFYDVNPFMLKFQMKNPDPSGQPLFDDGPKTKKSNKRARPLHDDDDEEDLLKEVKKVRN